MNSRKPASTASLNRLLNGVLLGNCGTFSIFRTTHPEYFHHDRRAEFHAREIAYFALADIVRPFQFRPRPKHITFRFPWFRRIQGFNVLARSLISCW